MMVEPDNGGEGSEDPFDIVTEQLRRFTLRAERTYRLALSSDDKVNAFRIFYFAAVRSNASVYKLLQLFDVFRGEDLIHELSLLSTLNNVRDVVLQIGIALKLERGDESKTVAFIVEKLEKIKHISDPKIAKKLLGMVPKIDAIVVSKVSAGSIIATGLLSQCAVAKLDSVLAWTGDHIGLLESMPLAVKSQGMILKRSETTDLKQIFVPWMSKLLLRSSAIAIGLLVTIRNGLPREIVFGDLFDALWNVLCSDNDETRSKAEIIFADCEPMLFAKKMEATFGGKSIKVKKSMVSGFLKSIRMDNPERANFVDIIKNLIVKETSEEVIYWLACCLAEYSCALVMEDAKKQSKVGVKQAYLAAIASVKTYASNQAVKEASIGVDNLLAILAGGVCDVSTIKNGLKATGGFLGERCVTETVSKYPNICIERLVSLFALIKDNHDLCVSLWKTLLSLAKNRAIIQAVHHNAVDCKSLSQAIGNIYEPSDAKTVAKLVEAAVRTRADLVHFIVISREGCWAELNLWQMLCGKAKAADVDGSLVFDQLIGNDNVVVLNDAAKRFPEVAAVLGDQLVSEITKLANMSVSAEDCLILNTADEKLPVVDILVQPKRPQPISKDLGKKLTMMLPTNSNKPEKSAVDVEIQREKEIKRQLQGEIEYVGKLTRVCDAVAENCPRGLEPFLGLVVPIYAIVSQEWIKKEASRLLYVLLRCCSAPLGRRGPLLVTSLLIMRQDKQLIDSNWDASLVAVANHCVNEASQSTFRIAMPVLLQLLDNAAKFELSIEPLLNLLECIKLNAPHVDGGFEDILHAFTSLISCNPSLRSTSDAVISTVISNSAIAAPPADLEKLLQSSNEQQRRFGLHVIQCFAERFGNSVITERVLTWIAIMAHDEFCASIAKDLYEKSTMIVNPSKVFAIATADQYDSAISDAAINTLKAVNFCSAEALISEYRILFKRRLPEVVNVRNANTDLTKISRARLATAFTVLADMMPVDETLSMIKFFLEEAFYDPLEEVHAPLLDAAGTLVDRFADTKGNQLAIICEEFLGGNAKGDEASDRVRGGAKGDETSDRVRANATTNETSDRVRVYAIILMAKITKKFDRQDSRRKTLLLSLMGILVTPSESVQNAVADAMIDLYQCLDEVATRECVRQLLDATIKGKSIAIRRGSAYGLAALIKGQGSTTIRQYGILEKITSVLQDKQSTMEMKEGSLFVLELTSRYLGNCFEPYIIRLLDVLIGIFADGRAEIHEATMDAAKTMMSYVSSLGARLILPILLNLMSTTSWRSKVGAIEWLGAMANLAPRVLAKQLPKILPKLVDALIDSHHAVQKASREALQRYGSVVKNPEIRALSSLILAALADPPQSTEKCLHAILHTAFSHVIDGPSLALLEPVLVRALMDRATGGTEVKKMAAQIIGNLATNLVDTRDLVVVLDGIVPALVSCLSDPVPEVRSHCGKVLGILVKTVGESHSAMASLERMLMNMISGSLATSVDRAGAALALAEIYAARGPERTADVLEGTVAMGMTSNKLVVKEGFVTLLGFLPAAFDSYGTLVELYGCGMRGMISIALGLIADENEAVREAATQACHQIIARFARIDHVAIFDVLTETLSDSRWRCRLGCLQLFQEFLSKFSANDSDVHAGVFSTPTAEELGEGGIDAARIQLLMAKLFMCRFDQNSSTIRHVALTIWKSLASHPLRALMQILNLLVEESCKALIIVPDSDELVQKVFEDVLSKIGDRVILSLLSKCTELFDASTMENKTSVSVIFIATIAVHQMGREGFPSLTTNLLGQIVPKTIDLLQRGLFSGEDDGQVTKQACRLFVALRETGERFGVDSLVDNVVGSIVDDLTTDVVYDPVTLRALVALLKVDGSGQVFSFAVKKFVNAWRQGPKEVDSAKSLLEILSAIFECIGAEGAYQCIPVLKVILDSEIYARLDEASLSRAFSSILAALEADEDSVYQVSLSQLLETLFSEGRSSCSFRLIGYYCNISGADASRFYDIWPRRLFIGVGKHQAGAEACLSALLERVAVENTAMFAENLRAALNFVDTIDSNGKTVVLLLVKKIIVPLLTNTTMLQYGDEECRLLACDITRRLAEIVTTAAWASSLTALVGTLIRTASDRKMASECIFEALTRCVIVQTMQIKPFHPQLQRIYLNALSVDEYRELAVDSLVALAPCLSRAEQLVNELLSMAETVDASAGRISEADLDRVSKASMDRVSKADTARMAAIVVLRRAKIVGDASKTLSVATICMSDSDTKIRNVAAGWVEVLISAPEMAECKEKLKALLKIA